MLCCFFVSVLLVGTRTFSVSLVSPLICSAGAEGDSALHELLKPQ